MTAARRPVLFSFRLLGRLIRWLVFLALGLVVYLYVVGVPQPLARRALAMMDLGPWHVEAEQVHFSLRRGLQLSGVAFFRKGVVGPPAFEVEHADVGLRPEALFGEGLLLTELELRGGVLRPGQCAAAVRAAAAPGGGSTPGRFRLTCRSFELQGLQIDELVTDVVLEPGVLAFSDMTVTLGGSESHSRLRGNWEYDFRSSVLRAEADGTIDPRLLQPYLKALGYLYLEELVQRFDFPPSSPPHLEMVLARECVEGGKFDLRGTGRLRQGSYRGVDVLSAEGDFSFLRDGETCRFALDPLYVARKEGLAQIGFTVDLNRQLVSFQGRSGASPKALVQMIGILQDGFLQKCTFNGPTQLDLEGQVGFGPERTSTMVGTFTAQRAGVWGLVSDHLVFDVNVGDGVYGFENVVGGLCGGELSGSVAVFSPGDGSARSHCAIDLSLVRAEFGAVMTLCTDQAHDYRGRFDTMFSVIGPTGDDFLQQAKGKARLKIREGHVFMFPVFGGLSSLMMRLIPGLDFVLSQGDASADFDLANGVAQTDNLRIEGDVLSLTGHGAYHVNDQLDFNVQVRLLKQNTLVAKLLKVLTYPLSKLFEFRVRGTRGDATWYPVHFSSDLLERLGLKSDKKEAGVGEAETGGETE